MLRKGKIITLSLLQACVNNSRMPATLPNRSLAWASDRLGWAGSSPAPKKLCWARTGPAQQKIIKKIKNTDKKKKNKECVCENKNNVNLLVYSLTPESGIKIPV